ncbi:MAG: glycerophosphodiester phosphodiesterase family protein [Planctomycetota bacterium]
MIATAPLHPTPTPAAPRTHASRAEAILQAWHDPTSPLVLVVAHRGAHRGLGASAPENSIAAIEDAITMGCDMVEVDVRRTSDGRFVLMHDTTVDRTTTGSGYLHQLTLSEVRRLRLLDAAGEPTDHAVPTLEEALEACRGRILINLDKTGRHTGDCLAVAEHLGVADHVVLKGAVQPTLLGEYLGGLGLSELTEAQGQTHPTFMPIASFSDESALEARSHVAALLGRGPNDRWPAIEICLRGTAAGDRLIEHARDATRGRTRFWMNSLWDSISGGRSDDRAAVDPDAVWGWMVDHGVTVIQTDEPLRCLRYLRGRGLRW